MNVYEESYRGRRTLGSGIEVKGTGGSRNRAVTNGDTPTGLYRVTGSQGNANANQRLAYGPNDRLQLESNTPNGRTLLRIHGGRQEGDPNPTLKRTNGCLRVYDEDEARLLQMLEPYRNSKNGFDDVYLNVEDGLQTPSEPVDVDAILHPPDAMGQYLEPPAQSAPEADYTPLPLEMLGSSQDVCQEEPGPAECPAAPAQGAPKSIEELLGISVDAPASPVEPVLSCPGSGSGAGAGSGSGSGSGAGSSSGEGGNAKKGEDQTPPAPPDPPTPQDQAEGLLGYVDDGAEGTGALVDAVDYKARQVAAGMAEGSGIEHAKATAKVIMGEQAVDGLKGDIGDLDQRIADLNKEQLAGAYMPDRRDAAGLAELMEEESALIQDREKFQSLLKQEQRLLGIAKSEQALAKAELASLSATSRWTGPASNVLDGIGVVFDAAEGWSDKSRETTFGKSVNAGAYGTASFLASRNPIVALADTISGGAAKAILQYPVSDTKAKELAAKYTSGKFGYETPLIGGVVGPVLGPATQMIASTSNSIASGNLGKDLSAGWDALPSTFMAGVGVIQSKVSQSVFGEDEAGKP